VMHTQKYSSNHRMHSRGHRNMWKNMIYYLSPVRCL